MIKRMKDPVSHQRHEAKVRPLTTLTDKYVAIPASRRIDLIATREIHYLKSDGNYTEFHMSDGSTILSSKTMKTYEAKLRPPEFVRIHNSYIIRVDKLSAFLHNQSEIVMQNNNILPVSRNRKKGLMNILRMFMTVALFTLSYAIQAQVFTQWEQGAPSDYYFNVNWAANTNTGCGCYWGNDLMGGYLAGSPDYLLAQQSFPHANTQSGPTAYALGPDRIHNVLGVIGVQGGTLVSSVCFENCVSSAQSPSIVMQTDLPYPPVNISPSWDQDGIITLHWTNDTDIPEGKYSTLIYRGALLVAEIPGYGTSWTESVCVTPGTTYQFYGKYEGETAGQYYVRNSFPPTNYTIQEWPQPNPMPIGTIKGKVQTLSGAPVSGLKMVATLLNPSEITNGACWPIHDTVTTQQFTGNYTFENLYWGSGQDTGKYEIRPYSPDPQREFNPDSHFVKLYAAPNNIIESVNFTDITSYSVNGTIRDINGCGLDSVQISTIGNSAPAVYSQINGTYALVVPEQATYDIVVSYNNIPFDTLQLNVVGNPENVDFIYAKVDTIQGFVGGGCFEFLGKAEITVRGKDDCIIDIDTTDTDGFYTMTLPSRELNMQVSDYFPLNSTLDYDDIYPAIDSIYEIDLDSTTEINIVYRQPLTLELSGIPSPPCAAMPYPVMNQGQIYGVQIIVWESVGVCLADTGSIVIQNDISTTALESPIQDTIPFSNGVAHYLIRPGEPNIVAPYVKNLTIKAIADNQQVSQTMQIVVSGSRQRTGTFYTTAPKTLPFMILRDPPGDQSHSWFESATSVEYVDSYEEQLGGGGSLWGKAKFKGGSEDWFQVWGEIGGKLAVQTINSDATSQTLQMTTSQMISTSPDALTGTDGDVIMYGGVNFRYGLTDDRIFDINTCSIRKDTSIAFSPDALAEETTAIRSVRSIKDEVIPDLILLANNSNTSAEQREKLLRQINLWEQTLQVNEEMKADALAANAQSFTIDAGVGATTSTFSGRSSQSKSLTFLTEVDAELQVSAGVKTKFFEGEAGFSVNIKKTFGGSSAESMDSTWSTGYTFDDGDVVLGNENATIDEFSFKVAIDSVFGTPVFSAPIGKSSCPWEDGMQHVDLATVSVANPNVYVPSGDVATFTFIITNISESNDDRTYRMELNDGSNPLGATVHIGGSPGPKDYFIESGDEQQVTVHVIRPAGPDYQFEGLQFYVYNPCDFLVRKEISVSAYFANDCSNIIMTAPGNDWVLSANDDDMLQVTADNYTISPEMTEMRLTYKPGWSGSGVFLNTNIVLAYGDLIGSPAPHTFDWDVSERPDGNYTIRWEIQCGSTINYSQRRRGTIDRTPPRVFGNPKPHDNVYYPGDVILAQFNDLIAPPSMSNLTGYMCTYPEADTFPVQIAVQGDSVVVSPLQNISGFYSQEFEVGLMHVSDMHGNAMTDTVRWYFTVNEPDSDRDGVPDTKDRCPGGNDLSDSDMGGLPDDCDCSPTDAFNDKLLLTNQDNVQMDFDGIDDFIEIPNVPSVVPSEEQSMTFEAWIKPADVTGSQAIATSAATLSNYNFGIYLSNDFLRVTARNTIILQSTSTIPANTWTHVAVVFDADSLNAGASRISIFLNGSLDNFLVDTFEATNKGNPILLGDINSTSWPFHGQMDEVRFWRAVRSPFEIAGFMDQELKGMEQNLVLYYDFNEGIPNGDNTAEVSVQDQAGVAHNGVLNNFAQTGSSSNWTVGEVALTKITYDSLDLCKTCPDTVNVAMDFTKSSPQATTHPYLSIPFNTAISPAVDQATTYEVWLHPDSISSGGSVIITQETNTSGIHFRIMLDTDGYVQLELFGESYLSADPVPLNAWTHLAVKVTPLVVQIYLNGALSLDSPLISGGATITMQPITISSDDPNLAFNGIMDDLRLWKIGRSAVEIADHFLVELFGNEPDLFGYYNFNTGKPGLNNTALTVVTDATANANDAIPFHFAQSGPFSNWVTSVMNFPDGDLDGLPDVCDDCFAYKDVLLEDLTLDGVYRAREKIILGNNVTIPISGDVTLRAPLVLASEIIELMTGATITIDPEPCEVE